MFNPPIRVEDVQIKMFLPAPYGSRQQTVEQEVNEWLSKMSEEKPDTQINAIFYQHCTTPKPAPKDPTHISEDKVSVMVVYGGSKYKYYK